MKDVFYNTAINMDEEAAWAENHARKATGANADFLMRASEMFAKLADDNWFNIAGPTAREYFRSKA